MHPLIEYFKSPELVVQIQEYFGIRYNIANGTNGLKQTNDKDVCDKSQIKNYDDNNVKSHKRNISNDSMTTNPESDSSIEFTEAADKKDLSYRVTNVFWYYLFIIGTALGDEIFYATFIPFWFWNIDGAVGRRVVMVWSSVMYVGQTLKDVIKWTRPGPPVARLQKKWALEYGMPSTHAMVAIAIPFSVLIYTMDRYQYSVKVGLIISIIWCTLICVSRLYLGMHSVLDIIAGIFLTIILMIPLIPIVDRLDYLILSSRISPLIILAISITLIVYYPDSGKWTPTRGDTTLTVSVCAGIEIGAWVIFQKGDMVPPTTPPPYEIIWPSYAMLGLILLRTVLGLCCIVATRAIGKSMSYAFVCTLLGKDKNELRNSVNSLENKNKIIVELAYKFFTYGMIGINTQYLLPTVFKMLNIGRPDFYTEI